MSTGTYDWLTEALQGTSQVVTGNRRLAQALTDHHASSQVESGRKAWRSPHILAWQDWLKELLATAELVAPLPTRLNMYQSRILWERCLRREFSEPLVNTAALARQAQDTWIRLSEYCVPLEQVTASAQGRDQRIFASAAVSYQSILGREGWIDDAGLAALATQLLRDGQAVALQKLTFAGFDRFTPVANLLLDALRVGGSEIVEIQSPVPDNKGQIAAYENSDAEMRAAGAWARQALLDDPEQDIAIVTAQLDRDSERLARLVHEALVPGWQIAGHSHRSAVNVSYGKRLSNYPAIAVALNWLRWSLEDVDSRQVSQLLRSPACGDDDMGGRSRLDMQLRRLPAMNWSPRRFLAAFMHTGTDTNDSDWFDSVRTLQEFRQKSRGREPPSQWALRIDEFLGDLHWPGNAALNSIEFQLVNRWRELLNDFARLELVAPSMSLGSALSRLQTMAGETVFQPESDGAIVQLLGPLEAAGMQFDRLWVSGMSSSQWPPAGRPSPLVSRQLQRDYSMPDAEPGDTLAYASRMLGRLAASTDALVFSYPLADGDVEQSPSGLLGQLAQPGLTPVDDPGWYARHMVDGIRSRIIDHDPVPPVTSGEVIKGGAATLQQQRTNPFAAFALGRLGIRRIVPLVNGLPATLRGNLIHDALFELYRELPSREVIASWSTTDLERRAPQILSKAFARLESCSDGTLRQVLKLEKHRVADLLEQVIALDSTRSDFAIEGLEKSLDLVIDQVQLGLRIDRVDRVDGNELVIIDYKTGQQRRFLNSGKEPDDVQLVAYACAFTDQVAGLAYMNVDSRQVDLNGAGREFTPDLNWADDLARWRQEVVLAAQELQKGDIRINAALPVKSSRSVGLLSRIRELQSDH